MSLLNYYLQIKLKTPKINQKGGYYSALVTNNLTNNIQ